MKQTLLFQSSGCLKPITCKEVKKSKEGSSTVIDFPKIENLRNKTDKYIEPQTEKLETFIYPKDVTRRNYQFDAVKQALKENTIVCLPTGSGKTLIAAVLIMNFHRWFPDGIIMFIAPTRTLLEQQSKFCLSFITIPQNHCCILSGSQRRSDVWNKSKIFFTTPQIVQNDLKNQIIDPTKVVLVIFDEVHHARGHHPYSEIVQRIVSRNKFVRFVGLTATPGSNKQSIQDVVCKTLASSIFYLDESDEELKQYRHEIITESIEINNNDSEVINKLNDIMEIVAKPLRDSGVFMSKEISRGVLWIALQNNKNYHFSDVFGILLSLASIKEKVNRYGVSFLEKSLIDFENKKNVAKVVKMEEYKALKEISSKNCNMISNKIVKLREILNNYFDECPVGRVIVFAQYRDAVESIVNEINKFNCGKAVAFIGKVNGVNDSIQKATLKSFSNGEINILVSTCVGEEGIDIDDVGLIVCFDAQSSPIRMIQRMGRTGRKCQGRCITFVSQGIERKLWAKSKYNNKNMTSLLNNTNWLVFHKSDLIIPESIKCVSIACMGDQKDGEIDDSKLNKGKSFISKRQNIELKQIFGMTLNYRSLSLNNGQICRSHLFKKSAASKILFPVEDLFYCEEEETETNFSMSDSESNDDLIIKYSYFSDDEDIKTKNADDASELTSPIADQNILDQHSFFSDDEEFDFL